MSTPMALPTAGPAPTVRRGDRLLAPLCLTLAERLLRLEFGHIVAVVQRGKQWCRPATVDEAARITAAVQQAGRHRAGRVACLECSLATVLLAVLRRRAVDWCIGARMMPYASHAWNEVDGQAIGEPEFRDRPYHVLLRV